MSDFDPVTIDLMREEVIPPQWSEDWYVESLEVPKLIANELRRLYESHGDPSLYWLVLRAQEIESL